MRRKYDQSAEGETLQKGKILGPISGLIRGL